MYGMPGQPVPENLAEMIEAAERLNEAVRAEEIASRRMVLRWGAILCTCTRRYAPDEPVPAAARCPVHGAVMVTASGEVL